MMARVCVCADNGQAQLIRAPSSEARCARRNTLRGAEPAARVGPCAC